jgi:phosphoribosylformimino-5-aminoimidazole carboxamide ribotide isomerase
LILYPALDLQGGRVVRLRQGDLAQQTIYSDDPAAVAARWLAAGAEWLHVINLDGAFSMDNDNEQVVRTLADYGVPIQFGGGLRSLDDVDRAFDLGVSRVILGTLAVEQADSVVTVLDQWGADAIAVALDSRQGRVATRGWQQIADVSPVELGRTMAAQGVRHALYTDVSRDGELTGVNVTATVELAQATGLEVIASGGITSLGDIVALRESGSVAGAILGTALYEGLIDLAEAIRLAREE